MADDLETLTDLVSSEGWRLFGEHAQREWGPSGLRFQQAVKAASESQTAVVDLQKVIHTQEAIWVLLTWPSAQVSALRDRQQAALAGPTMSRRGPGL